MKKIKVSEFKTKISAYMRAIKAGKEFLITDRNLPIAQVTPVKDHNVLRIEHAEVTFQQALNSLPPLVGPLLSGVNSTTLLREDRNKR